MKQLTITGNCAGWGSNFIRVLDHLIWCEKNNIQPYIKLGPETSCFWDGKTDNIWELFYENTNKFDSKNQIVVPQKVEIMTDFRNPECLSRANRIKGESAYKTYIEPRMKPQLKNKINLIMNTLGLESGKFTSIHIRGTDWYEYHVKTLRSVLFPLPKYLSYINNFYDVSQKLFVMSDNHETIKFLKKYYPKTVFYAEADRAQNYNGSSIHPSWNNSSGGNPKLAEDVIIESTIASYGDSFIHLEGNTDLIVLLMNSNLKSKYIKTI